MLSMSKQPSKPKLRNRRFLVSLWQPVQPGETSRNTDRDDLPGVVWEANPSEPGRITTPLDFVGLNTLPAVLGQLLEQDTDSP